jgi:hypothetical protein
VISGHTERTDNYHKCKINLESVELVIVLAYEKEVQATYNGLDASKPNSGAVVPFLHLNIVLK